MILAASFHIHEEGFEHQIDVAKDITQPEDLMNWNDLLIKYESVLSQEAKFFLKCRDQLSLGQCFMIFLVTENHYHLLITFGLN